MNRFRMSGYLALRKICKTSESLCKLYPILAESFFSAFHVVAYKLLIVFIKFLMETRQKSLYFLCNFC